METRRVKAFPSIDKHWENKANKYISKEHCRRRLDDILMKTCINFISPREYTVEYRTLFQYQDSLSGYCIPIVRIRRS